MQPVISLKNITKTFTDHPDEHLETLSNINLEILRGEFFVFVGPSGSGKSTLLRIMSGLEKSYSGSVTLAPGMSQRDMSFVFQQFALFPWLTVAENIGFGLAARHLPPTQQHRIIADELKRFGLEKFAHAHPHELSGGMRQRVGVARALATSPKILFMDEPFSELDSFTAAELRSELLTIWEERKPTVIMVTHMIEDAVELADRIAVLTPRPGRIERIVENLLPRPRGKRSSGFYKLEDEIYKIIKP